MVARLAEFGKASRNPASARSGRAVTNPGGHSARGSQEYR
jgi:hypothetical protein